MRQLFEKREADVSVLFADITGYTSSPPSRELHEVNKRWNGISGRSWMEIISVAATSMKRQATGYGIIFRRGSEGHATAAIRAAQAIQRRAREINQNQGSVRAGRDARGRTSIAALATRNRRSGRGSAGHYTASGSTTKRRREAGRAVRGRGCVAIRGTYRTRSRQQTQIETRIWDSAAEERAATQRVYRSI